MTPNPTTLPASARLHGAAQAMRETDIGDVVVLDENGIICGEVTDRDIVVRAPADDQPPVRTRSRQVCSPNGATVGSTDEVDDVVRTMREQALRRLPVTQDDRRVGIVSLGDLAIERLPESVLARISAAPEKHVNRPTATLVESPDPSRC